MACQPQISAGHLKFLFRSGSGLSLIISKRGPSLLLTQSESGGLGHHLHPPLNGVLQKLFKKKKINCTVQHVGDSSLTKNRTRKPCSKSVDS